MMSEYVLNVRTFEMGTEKESAIKVLEEASEVRAAWQMLDGYEPPDWEPHPYAMAEKMWINLADEIADVIQAACNLAARYDIRPSDLDSAMRRCTERNLARGRYAD